MDKCSCPEGETYRFQLQGHDDVFSRTFEIRNIRAGKIAELLTHSVPRLKSIPPSKIRLKIDGDTLNENCALNEVVNSDEIIDIIF